MPRGKRARRRNQTVSDADNDFGIHRDETSTALVATTLNIASESDMKTGAKRALAECLENDDLNSEVVNDAMWTGNSAGLHIARENGRLPVLETTVKTLEADLRNTIAELRETQATVRSEKKKTSDLHDLLNQVGQQTNAQYVVGFSQIRSRFISTFRRDILQNASDEDKEFIGRGNIAAHVGNFLADAKLYEDKGFIAEDGTQIPPRNDKDVFIRLYGVSPSFSRMIDYTPTIYVLNKHGTIISSTNLQTTHKFEERFDAFIHSLKASKYASGYLNSTSPQLEVLRIAYRAFWDAVRTEVSRLD